MDLPQGSSGSWPEGVQNAADMQRYVKALFGNCVVEDLLKGSDFDGQPQCFLWRVKDACKGDWYHWPKLIDKAMQHAVETYNNPYCVEVRTKSGRETRDRIYDSVQVTPHKCTCRVFFGGDGHQRKLQTSSQANKFTAEMAQILIAKFKPAKEHWNEDQVGYHKKAYHLVLNRYSLERQDGIDPHQDLSETYDSRNPIASLSYGCGSLLAISDSNKDSKRTALYYQFPGDAIVMSGQFNLRFWHAVPPVKSWPQLLECPRLVRSLPSDELKEAKAIIARVNHEACCTRWNVTIRWHQTHWEGCPYLPSTGAPAVTMKQETEPTDPADIDNGDAPCRPQLAAGLRRLNKSVPLSGTVRRIVGPNTPAQETLKTEVGAKKSEDRPAAAVAPADDTKAALRCQLIGVASAVPNWTGMLVALPLVPNRASQMYDRDVMQQLWQEQARYVQYLASQKRATCDDEHPWDQEIAQQLLQKETRKQGLIESRMQIYDTVMQAVTQVAFNEERLSADHCSGNDKHVRRVILTFKQARMLLGTVSLQYLVYDEMVIADISKIFNWNWYRECYVELDSFRRGTRQVQKFAVCTEFLHIKWLEASWPAASTFHRLRPLPGSIRGHVQNKKRAHGDDGDPWTDAENYCQMLSTLMISIQDFLVLSDTAEERGVENSLALLNRTAKSQDDFLICMGIATFRPYE